MRNFALLITSLFLTMGATAQITAVSELSNDKCYQIRSTDTKRGVFYAAEDAEYLSTCGGTYSGYPNQDISISTTETNQQFALISYLSNYYLYSVSEKKFAVRASDGYIQLSNTPSSFVTITREDSYFVIKMNGTNMLNLAMPTDAVAGVNANYDTPDGGNQLVITEAGEFNPAEALAVLQETFPYFVQEFTNGSQPTPWDSETATAPDGMETSCSDAGTTTVRKAETTVKVVNTTVTVNFEYISRNNSNHKLHILGVDLIDSDGNVVKSDYHSGTAGSSPANTLYTLSDLTAGEYTLRYFVCNNASDHMLTNTAGDITVTGAKQSNTKAKNELGELIDFVVGNYNVNGMIGDKVGQRSSTIDDWFAQFQTITEYHSNITESTAIQEIEEKTATLQGIIDSFTIIHMPVDGKAYTFKNVQRDGTTVCWIKYENNVLGTTTSESEATLFVCRLIEGSTYAFVNNDGKYMKIMSSDNGNTGICDSYDNTSTHYTNITIEKSSGTSQYVLNDCKYTRYVYLKGPQHDFPSKTRYMIISKSTLAFDMSGAPYYNDSYSSAFIMEEADYANTPKLNSVGTSPLLTPSLHNKSMATFSAPFPTITPAGVTAYYAAEEREGSINIQPIEGAIPANTGVILVGETAGEFTMLPVTTESIATIENNLLSHSAGAAIELQDGYILGKFDDVVGFYKARPIEASPNSKYLAMNKAYLAVSTNQASMTLRFPGTTSIEDIENEPDETRTIYDLQGRKLNEITTPGIYIINGKKVIIK